jgi:hypothetical protein
MSMNELIADWKNMRSALAAQIYLMESGDSVMPPISLWG